MIVLGSFENIFYCQMPGFREKKKKKEVGIGKGININVSKQKNLGIFFSHIKYLSLP